MSPLAITTLLNHGYGHLRCFPNNTHQLTLTFVPKAGESLNDLEIRVQAQRQPDDQVEITVRDGRVTRIDVLRMM